MTSLVDYLSDGATDPVADALAGWLATVPRFRDFADAHRDKIRKKLRSAIDADARLDVLAELRAARQLLEDRRIELAFEPAGSTRGGPDFAVTFRERAAFNLEVTRLRRDPSTAALSRVILVKLRQLPPSAPNVLLIAADGDADIAAATRDLRARIDARDAELLDRGGFATPRDFYARYLRLGAVIAWGADGPSAWINPAARIAVPASALRACETRLRSRQGSQRG